MGLNARHLAMDTFISPVLGGLLLLAATGSAGIATTSTDAASETAPAFVESTEILYLESYPVQVNLAVQGTLPTPCHEPVYSVQHLGDSIDVHLWSQADPDQVCVQVLEPFELTIPLGSYESSDWPVILNGEDVGRIAIGSVSREPAVTAAGWSFGFCLGNCRADLVIDGTALALSGGDRESDPPLYTNTGTLTAAGAARLEAELAALDGVSLEPVYGCPDCADGGAAYLQLRNDDGSERVEMELGRPPAVLAPLYETTMVIMGALETCRSNELVEVAPDCVVYERG